MISRAVQNGAALLSSKSAPFLVLTLVLLLLPMDATAQSPSAEPADEVIAEAPDMFRLSGYKGLYFLYGNPSGKIQISAKQQVVEGIHTYFGYTQMMLWEFARESNPFSDVNFNPEIFHRFILNPRASIDIGPVEHLSNGRDGIFSRGLNTSYVRFNNAFVFRPIRFDGGVKFFALWDLDPNNRDLSDYIGFWTGEVSATMKDLWIPFWQVYARVNPGGGWGNRFEQGSQELGLSMKFDRGTALPFVYLQYFNGYGESLLTYNQISSSIRIGVRR